MLRKQKQGYTITEMMVVMATMAVLTVIGISGLLSARDSGYAEETSQGIATAVRQAQNKALAVEVRGEAKVWGVKITASDGANPGSYQIVSFERVLQADDTYLNNLLLNDEISTETPLCNSTSMTCRSISRIEIIDGATSLPYVYIAYSSPFSKPYIVTETNGCGDPYNTLCNWIETGGPAQDWMPSPTSSYFSDFLSNPTRVIQIKITHKSNSRILKINANGECSFDEL